MIFKIMESNGRNITYTPSIFTYNFHNYLSHSFYNWIQF